MQARKRDVKAQGKKDKALASVAAAAPKNLKTVTTSSTGGVLLDS